MTASYMRRPTSPWRVTSKTLVSSWRAEWRSSTNAGGGERRAGRGKGGAQEAGPEAGVGPAAARLVIFEFYIYICIAKQFKLA